MDTSSAAVSYLRIRSFGISSAATHSEAYSFLSIRPVAGLYSKGRISSKTRGVKKWKPMANVPLVDKNGIISQPWNQFLDYMANKKLGGPTAHTLPQVEQGLTRSDAQILIAQGIKDGLSQIIAANAQTLAAAVEVVKASGLAGSAQIPTVITTLPDVGYGGSGDGGAGDGGSGDGGGGDSGDGGGGDGGY